MKLSLCLEMLFNHRPFVDRVSIASRLGYRFIEFWDWRDKDIPAIAEAAAEHDVGVAAMSGNRKHALIDPDAGPGLIEEMEQVFSAASLLNCRYIMMLSDVLRDDGSAAPTEPRTVEEKIDAIARNLRMLVSDQRTAEFTLLLEPLNTAFDHRGCFLNHSAAGVEIVRRINNPRVRLLYDIYHMSMMGEDVYSEIDNNLEWIGYLHVADMPGRHQPGSGTIDYQAVNALLRRAQYDGFVGMEFSALGPEEPAARVPLEVFS